MKKKFCIHGHNISVVGRDKWGSCNRCLLIKSRKDPNKDSRIKRFCLNGHDTSKCGRYSDNSCKECGRIKGRKKYVPVPLNKRKDRHKRFCPRGHDTKFVGRNKQRQCRQCANEMSIQYSRKYPERIRNSQLKYQYGITLNQYNVLLLKQKRKCLGCNIVAKHLVVDHDHKTGKVRGLLCHNCNCVIGYALENPKTLKNLASYIKRNRKTTT